MIEPLSTSEKRRHVRLEKNIPLRIVTDETEFVTETRNLSCSGAYCQVNRYIAPMTKLKIQLFLPLKIHNKIQTKKVLCQGVIVRIENVPRENAYNIAIFFNEIQQKDSDRISEFINSIIQIRN